MMRRIIDALCGHLLRGADVLDHYNNPWWLFPFRAYLFCVFAFIVFVAWPYRMKGDSKW